jgi:polysaccharide pyruvyl transferase WcaK-like protein
VEEVGAWITEQKHQGKAVVVLNISHHIIRGDHRLIEGALIKILDAVGQVAAKVPLALVLLPHDVRGDINDDVLNQRFMDLWRSKPTFSDIQIINAGIPISAREAKAVVGMVDLVLTGRMHLAIAALGMTTPIACMTYQDKFEGLFEHFELSGASIEGQEIWQEQKLYELLSRSLANRLESKAVIERGLPRVLSLARKNIEWAF